MHKNSKKKSAQCRADCSLTSEQQTSPNVKTVNVFPHCFVPTFPQMEKTAEMFPVSLDGREANLADETLPLGVEMVLPAQLIEVTLKQKKLDRTSSSSASPSGLSPSPEAQTELAATV